jgi:rod shape-determining protein MreD
VIADRLIVLRRAGPVLIGVLLVQVGVMTGLPAFGAVADLMLLVTLAAASVGGPDKGATYGFAAGLLYDLVLDTPFGMSALVYALVGYAIGVFGAWALQPRWWFHVLAAIGGSVASVILTVLVARVLGLPYPLDDVIRIAIVVATWNALLIVPARRLLRWVIGDPDGAADRFRIALP